MLKEFLIKPFQELFALRVLTMRGDKLLFQVFQCTHSCFPDPGFPPTLKLRRTGRRGAGFRKFALLNVEETPDQVRGRSFAKLVPR